MPQILINNRLALASRLDTRAEGFAEVTPRELIASLLDAKGATIVTLIALTVPSYRKKGFAYRDNINKLARVNGFLNWNYEKSVNTRRIKEGLAADFESEPRAWGTHLDGTPFISFVTREGDHKLYIKFKVQTVIDTVYLTNDGDEIPIDEVEPFLDAKSRHYRQGLQEEVQERDYTVSNLISVSYNKMGYLIR